MMKFFLSGFVSFGWLFGGLVALSHVAAASENQAHRFMHYHGTVEAVKNANIGTQVAGIITQMRVSEGSYVKKGQVLASIDSRSAKSQVQAAQSQVAAMQAKLNVAGAHLKRQQQLYAKKYISKAALERAHAEYVSAQAQVNTLKAQTNIAKIQQDYFVIRAPFSGIVSQLNVVMGDTAMPGKTMMRLYQNSGQRVVVNLPQSVASTVQLKNTAAFHVVINSSTTSIPIQYAELLPIANPSSHTQQLRLYFSYVPKNITPGMSAKVGIPLQQHSTISSTISPNVGSTGISSITNNENTRQTGYGMQRVYVPNKAIIRRGDVVGVYVYSPTGKPLLRQVRLGNSMNGKTEVLSGISAGEKVSINPAKAALASRQHMQDSRK